MTFVPRSILVDRRRLLAFLVVAMLLLVTLSARAAVDTFEFANDDQQHRFRTLSNEFRCPMCQNTNLTGSGGGVAEDLRREIYLMIIDGKTDDEIKQFMFERYGDFIFYRPRLMTQTILLWFGPLLFLLFGGWLVAGIIRRARSRVQPETALDDAEQERLRKLLEKINK